MNLLITEIDEYIDVTNFNSKDPNVNSFLKKNALKNKKNLLTRTYILLDTDTNSTVGYITLSANKLELATSEKYEMRHVPAILLGRIGVDNKFREKDYGMKLIQYAIGICNEVKNFIGCRLFIAEVNKDSDIKDYLLKKGFFEELSDKRYHYLSIDLLI
jgi:predicted GNAT family N-acyltransferase